MANPNKCEIQYTKEAISDINSLPTHVLRDFADTIDKLKNNIHLGLPLFNKNGKDLTGCFKLYFADATYRIVYRKCTNTAIEVSGVTYRAEVLGVGKRDKQEIYNTVDRRIKEWAKNSKKS